MRIPVSVVVGQIAHGASWDEVLQGYPDLEREDIPQSLEYAGVLAENVPDIHRLGYNVSKEHSP